MMKTTRFVSLVRPLLLSLLLSPLSLAQSLENGGLKLSYPDCGLSVFTGMKEICALVDFTGSGCGQVTNTCVEGTRELFSGTTIELASPQNIKMWNGLGGLGAFYNSAALCLLRDLKDMPEQKIETSATTSLIQAEAKQEVVFLGFDKTTYTFKGYHRLKACGPAVGCLDMFTQQFELKPVITNTVGQGKKAGAYEIRESYGLQLKADGIAQSFTTDLPSIDVPTPIGAIKVTPKFEVGRATGMIMAPFSGNKQTSFPSAYLPGKENRTYDVYGRNVGVLATTLLPIDTGANTTDFTYSQKGWISTLALGGRSTSPKIPVWTANGSEYPKRPDLNPKLARSEEEKTPNATLKASAEVTYGLETLLPAGLMKRITCSGFVSICMPEASIFAKPAFEMTYSSQFSILQNEQSYWNQKVTPGEFPVPLLWPDTFNQARELRIIANSSATVATSLESGVNLVINLTVKGPFGFTKKLINIHPRVTIPLASETAFSPAIKASARSLGSDVIQQKKLFQEYTSWNGIDQSKIGKDGGAAALQACIQAPSVPEATPPPPTSHPGDPNDLLELMEQPCNICVAWDEIKYKDENDIEKTEAKGLYVVFPTSQFNIPDANKWMCLQTAQLGCYDLCKYDKNGKRAIKHTAIELIAMGYDSQMPKSCKIYDPTHGHN